MNSKSGYNNKMKTTLLIVALLFFISACSSKKLPPLKTVDRVEISKFMGTWNVIANIPTFIEKDAFNASETYTWNEKEERIDVMFKFHAGSFTGREKEYSQKAWVYNKETNSEWRVQFFWPVKFAYLIIDLAPDYSYAVVAVPDRDYVWILAREKSINEDLYQKLVQDLKVKGFNTKLLKKVPQRI